MQSFVILFAYILTGGGHSSNMFCELILIVNSVYMCHDCVQGMCLMKSYVIIILIGVYTSPWEFQKPDIYHKNQFQSCSMIS